MAAAEAGDGSDGGAAGGSDGNSSGGTYRHTVWRVWRGGLMGTDIGVELRLGPAALET